MIERNVDLRPARADLLADIEHRRLVALALADHHRALDRQLVELAAHRVDRGLIGLFLLAVAAQPRRRHRRAFCHPHDFEREDALQQQVRLDCVDGIAGNDTWTALDAAVKGNSH